MKVYLMGAGPGDPGLLTLKAKAVLEKADVVVYDYLANELFLEYCRPDAEKIYVGKKGGDHTLTQDKINDLIVEKAKAGNMVARLKGGDPYIFGRGGEEAEELLEAGLDFEIVPGVTSPIAGAAYAGIPLTHRSFASSVSFVTGHEDPEKPESAHNWQALAQGTSTLVFLMGMKNLSDIARNLMEHGRSPQTPAALIRWGTTCRHRSVTGTLENIAQKAEEHNFTAPSLIVVGEVVQLHDKLNWFERKPLLGKGVVVTRAREQASGLLHDLQDLGACCIQFPSIQINPLADYTAVRETVGRLHEYDWIIFTSVNGVKHLWAQMAELGLDTRIFGSAKVAAIGPATAEALKEKGIVSDFVPPKYVAESVVQGLLDMGIAGKKVLIPRAAKAREVLPEELGKAGADVEILPVYETVPAEQGKDKVLKALEDGEIHYITFGSSSTVDNFFSLVPPDVVKQYPQVKTACIGPITAETLKGYGFEAAVMPGEFTIPALVQALVKDAQG